MRLRRRITNQARGLFLSAAATVCCVLIAPPAHAQFEGVIESDNITTDEMGAVVKFSMTMWIAKSMLKIQTVYANEIPATTMIYRNDKGVTWLLDPEAKTYAEIKQEKDPGRGEGDGSMKTDTPSTKRTGKKKKILGYQCEQVIIRQGEQSTELWGTKQLARISTAIAAVLGEEPAAPGSGELAKLGLYPLSSATKLGGMVVESQQVTRIDERKLGEEVFALPSGFEKRSMDQMFNSPEH